METSLHSTTSFKNVLYICHSQSQSRLRYIPVSICLNDDNDNWRQMIMIIRKTPSLSPFQRPFSRWTWVSRCLLKQRIMEVVETTGAISCAKLQSNQHYQQTNIQSRAYISIDAADPFPLSALTLSVGQQEVHSPRKNSMLVCLWQLSSTQTGISSCWWSNNYSVYNMS